VGHRQHLHGVGLAGAWVWGTIATCPAWSGPGCCRGHWCDLAAPRNIEKTATSGDTACLGLWGQLGRVPGPAAEAVVVLCFMCRVSWYLQLVAVACCCGLGFCVMWRLRWVSVNMAGACKRRTSRVSPWWGLPCRL
jgi:hypothetical protein